MFRPDCSDPSGQSRIAPNYYTNIWAREEEEESGVVVRNQTINKTWLEGCRMCAGGVESAIWKAENDKRRNSRGGGEEQGEKG